MSEVFKMYKTNEECVKSELSEIIKCIVLEIIAEQMKPGGLLHK